MQRVTMMIRMAAGIVKGIPPAQETKHIQENTIQPLGLEDGTVSQLMWGNPHKKAGDCAMQKEGYEESYPELLRPECEDQRARQNVQGKMTAGLKPRLCIA